MPKNTNLIWRNNLKRVMQERKITVSSLSTISDVSTTCIGQIRHHRQEPLRATKYLLAKALKIAESELFPMKEVVGPSRHRQGTKYVKVKGGEENYDNNSRSAEK